MNKTELNEYRTLAAEVRQIQGRLRALESSLCSPNGQRFTRTPRGSADQNRTMEALIESHQDLAELYTSKLLELNQKMKKIEEAIGSLDDPQERMLLRYRYLDGFNWPQVFNAMHFSRSQIFRMHGYALLHLQAKGAPEDYRDYSGLLDE